MICDDETGDPITIVDGNGNTIYAAALEIRRSGHGDWGGSYVGSSPYYDDGDCGPIIYANLAQGTPAIQTGNYLAFVDVGTIDIQIPKSVMKTLHGRRTYDVFLTIEDTAGDDGRQIFIGRLPVMSGGGNT